MNILAKIKRYHHVISNNIKHPQRLANLSGVYYATFKKPITNPFLPFSIDIEPTIRCNLKCPSCQSPMIKREKMDLSFSLFKEILDQIPTLLEIKITGMGEPLLNNDFFKMVDYAQRKNISVFSFSNGKIIDKEVATQIIESGLREITISIDGATPKTHNRIRVGSNLEQVLEAVKLLVFSRGRSRYPIISIWFVGRKSNIHELPDLLDICKKLKVDYLTFQHDLTFWGKEKWRRLMKEDALDRNIKFGEQIIKEAIKKAHYLGLKFIHFQKNKFHPKPGKQCYWPWQSCFVATNGEVVPCCLIADPQVKSLGDLSKERFRDVWNCKDYQEFRKMIRECRIPDFCKDCYEE
jgi:pyrroloquinoline quinone biosynthesis protein E